MSIGGLGLHHKEHGGIAYWNRERLCQVSWHLPTPSPESGTEVPRKLLPGEEPKMGPAGERLSPALPAQAPWSLPRLGIGATHPEVALWKGGTDRREAQQGTADRTVDQGPELWRQRWHTQG